MEENQQRMTADEVIERSQDIINTLRMHLQQATDALIAEQAEHTALRRRYSELVAEVTKMQEEAKADN
jgi:hypothetical protein